MPGGVNGPEPRRDIDHSASETHKPAISSVDQKLQTIANRKLTHFFKTAHTADDYQQRYEDLTKKPVKKKGFFNKLFKKKQTPPTDQEIATAKLVAEGSRAMLPQRAEEALEAQLALVKHGSAPYDPLATMVKITPLLDSSPTRYLTPDLLQQRQNLQRFAPLILDLMTSKDVNIWHCTPEDIGIFLSELARNHTTDEMPASLATALGGQRHADGSVIFTPDQLGEILVHLQAEVAFSAGLGGSTPIDRAPTPEQTAPPPAQDPAMPIKVAARGTTSVTDFAPRCNEYLSHMTASVEAMTACKAMLGILTKALADPSTAQSTNASAIADLQSEIVQLAQDIADQHEVLDANKGDFSLLQSIEAEIEELEEQREALEEELSGLQQGSQKPIAEQISDLMQEMKDIKAYFDLQHERLDNYLFLGDGEPEVEAMQASLRAQMDEAYRS